MLQISSRQFCSEILLYLKMILYDDLSLCNKCTITFSHNKDCARSFWNEMRSDHTNE